MSAIGGPSRTYQGVRGFSGAKLRTANWGTALVLTFSLRSASLTGRDTERGGVVVLSDMALVWMELGAGGGR